MTSLEGWSSTIELRPQQPPNHRLTPVAYRLPRQRRDFRARPAPHRVAPCAARGGLRWARSGIVAVTGQRERGTRQHTAQRRPQHMAQATAQIGVTGLGVMGRNLARNFARHGYTVALHNRTTSRTTAMVDQFGHEGNFVPAQTAQEFVQALERPRRLVIMVNAGPATDAVIDEFAPLLEAGDMIIDGGNAHFHDTRRREAKRREQNLHFVGMGVSGGEEVALNGPSIMPGGSQESYTSLGPMLETISAHVDGTPCCTHIGPDGAGHFVKMVHNGIEYADMQLIAEAYDLLRHGAGLEPAQIAETFRTWNTGRLDSYLIEITAEVLAHTDASTNQPFVNAALDQAEQKGTGRWTVQDALDLGVPVNGIAEAVFARSLSGHADLRRAARQLPGPKQTASQPNEFADQVEQALYASKLVS